MIDSFVGPPIFGFSKNLLFQRRGQFRLILPLLLLKPSRLTKAGTEMMLRLLEKKAALLCHLLLLILESQA
jgi:hypothetical protein